MGQQSISAVIITYNEERNIGRCLESLSGVVDEILVVDSFSTDRTEAICAEHDARFMQHAFAGHIEQKNYALSQASYDHVLSLDADEALTPALRDSVLAAKQHWDADGYSFNRLTNFCGHWVRHCGWYPDKKLRLFDRRKAHWGGVNPHDRVEMETGSRQRHIPGDLEHYSFYTIAQHLDQIRYFTDISSQSAHDKGQRSSLLKILVKPAFKFFQGYFLKLGFLDGFYGLVICINSAFAKYLKYLKLYELGKR